MWIILAIAIIATQANAIPARGKVGTISCKTTLEYESSHGKRVLHGPSISSKRFARYDDTLYEYYGDNVFFHLNGATLPDLGTPFFLSIDYAIYDRASLSESDPLRVSVKLVDRRKNTTCLNNPSTSSVITFYPGEEHRISLDYPHIEETALASVLAICRRARD